MRYLLLTFLYVVENSFGMYTYTGRYVGDFQEHMPLYLDQRLLKKETTLMDQYAKRQLENNISGSEFKESVKKYLESRIAFLEELFGIEINGRHNYALYGLKEYCKYVIEPYSDKTLEYWETEMELNEPLKIAFATYNGILLREARLKFESDNSRERLFKAIQTIGFLMMFPSIFPTVNKEIEGVLNVSKNYIFNRDIFNLKQFIIGLGCSYNISKKKKERLEYNLREPEYYLRKMYKMLYPDQEIPENLYAAPSKKGCVIM